MWSTHTALLPSQFPHLHSPAYSKGLVREKNHKETTGRVDHHNMAMTGLQIINFLELDYPLRLHTCLKEQGRTDHPPLDAEELQQMWLKVWCLCQISLLHAPSLERGEVEHIRASLEMEKGNQKVLWVGVKVVTCFQGKTRKIQPSLTSPEGFLSNKMSACILSI